MSRKFFSFWLVLVPDVILLYAGLVLSLRLRYGSDIDSGIAQAHYRAFTLIFILWLVVFFIHGLFELQSLRRYTALFFNLISSMLVNLLLAILYFYFQPNLILTPRRFLALDVAVSFALILLWQLVIKSFLRNRVLEEVYLFSFNNELAELERELSTHSYLGYRVLGHLNEQTLKQARFAQSQAIVLPEELHTKPEMISEFYKIRTSGVSFYNHKDFYEDLLRRVYLSQLNEIWFLENINYREKRFYNIVKRAVDIVLGLVTFAVFLVTYPVIAAIVKLDSKGPAIFTQERVGKNGKIFRIYKYRSMNKIEQNIWTAEKDPRITRVGKILRKTRIDELPQSINLMAGEISLVGPRPEQPGIVEALRRQVPFYDERHLVKPGLTGWAQLNIYAGSLEETKLKLQYDLYYIKHRSFLFDLEIILKTIYYILTWQGR